MTRRWLLFMAPLGLLGALSLLVAKGSLLSPLRRGAPPRVERRHVGPRHRGGHGEPSRGRALLLDLLAHRPVRGRPSGRHRSLVAAVPEAARPALDALRAGAHGWPARVSGRGGLARSSRNRGAGGRCVPGRGARRAFGARHVAAPDGLWGKREGGRGKG